ncbi:MAG: hypothetical protein ABEJ23_03280 [Haloarculaceae archaeon]
MSGTDPDDGGRPGFASERLAVDAERATATVSDALGGLSAAETEEGVAFRTVDGMLVAVLAPGEDDGSVELRYRTSPASESATLKARRVRAALDPYVTSAP